MLYCLLVCGGHRCEFPVGKLFSHVKVCQHAKDKTQVSPEFLEPLPIAERRFGSWSMDFITGLPACTNGCNAIFTYVDHLTK